MIISYREVLDAVSQYVPDINIIDVGRKVRECYDEIYTEVTSHLTLTVWDKTSNIGNFTPEQVIAQLGLIETDEVFYVTDRGNLVATVKHDVWTGDILTPETVKPKGEQWMSDYAKKLIFDQVVSHIVDQYVEDQLKEA